MARSAFAPLKAKASARVNVQGQYVGWGNFVLGVFAIVQVGQRIGMSSYPEKTSFIDVDIIRGMVQGMGCQLFKALINCWAPVVRKL